MKSEVWNVECGDHTCANTRVAGHRDLEPPPERDAVDGGHRGLQASLEESAERGIDLTER